MFKPSLFQENANDCCLPSTELDETVEAYLCLCKEWMTTEMSVSYKRQAFNSASGLMQIYEIMLNTGICDSCSECSLSSR